MEQWFEGVHLLGRFGASETGCWLLHFGGEAAILEMPPTGRGQRSPADTAAAAAKSLGLSVKFVLCTHAHSDHFSTATLDGFRRTFPKATIHLYEGFQKYIDEAHGIQWFQDSRELKLAGEPLVLIHAPKHSGTDTMVIFRGAICTGDWELNTVRSVHDGRSGITTERKLASIQRLLKFTVDRDYRIHQVYSVHANDRRADVNFADLMADTRVDRQLW